MGTTRIKVIDLSSDVEQIKTSRKRAQTAAIGKVKKPLLFKKPKKVKKSAVEQELQTQPPKTQITEEVAKTEALESKKVKVKQQRRGKKYQNAKLLVDRERFYQVDTALELVKKINISSFDGSVEAHIVAKQKGIRGFVTFPNPFGKVVKILVFAAKTDGLESNGVIFGNEQTIEQIAEKKLVPKRDFQQVLATPEFMPKLAQVGKILGPAGLMPNPKAQTVTDAPEVAIKKFGEGSVEFKTEAEAPVIHQVIGKTSQDTDKLRENLTALVRAVNLQKILKLYLVPTMGPSVKVDISTLLNVNPERESKD